MPVRPSHTRYQLDGAALRRLIKQSGKPKELIALAIGRTKETLTAYEYGKAVPSGETALALAAILGCQVEDFYTVIDDDDEWMDAIRAACVAGRRAQGLPDQIEDDDALAEAAALLTRSRK